MQRSLKWIPTAALFTGFLSGCAAQGEFSGRTAAHGMSRPAGNGTSAASSPIARSPRDRVEAILHAPSAFDCRGQGADENVFEEQCESDTRTND